MKLESLRERKIVRAAAAVLFTAICGLLLARAPLGEPWVNASYDYLFRFGERPVTNQIALILMDNEAFDHFQQTRAKPWNRGLHAQLLNRLADDGCALVVMDCFFRAPRDQMQDDALAAALRRQRCVVLMAEQAQVTHPALTGVRPTLPAEPFLNAAGSNWGVAWLDPDLDKIVRRHWPFPAPGPYPSLPWSAAQLAGARLNPEPQGQWLRYYGQHGAATRMSYRFALTQPPNYFKDRIVFVGTEPKTTVADGEADEFLTPYTRWTGETAGGVEILITSFLNLANEDWMRRPAGWIENLSLTAAAILLGLGICRKRIWAMCLSALFAAVAVTLIAAGWAYYSNTWFPWVVVIGGQVPCALIWAVASQSLVREAVVAPVAGVPVAAPELEEKAPEIPEFEILSPAFGKGAYGKVWLARNAIGQWQAVKVVYRSNFGENSDAYQREFNGIRRYKPVSDKHPGLLRVDFVSKMKDAGYFYYVMELGDALDSGWERVPTTYKPRDLVNVSRRLPGQKLPAKECLRIGTSLAEALDYLHSVGLTHRDIKPQNILFVNNEPKLADVGLLSEIRPPGEGTQVGTPGYMPPAPETPGTPQADIYALGMVLYVLCTGQKPSFFPEISTTLLRSSGLADFFPLNAVILKACQPEAAQRYASAAELRRALQDAQVALESSTGAVKVTQA